MRSKQTHSLQKLPTIALLARVEPLQVSESWAVGAGVVNLPPRPMGVSYQVELSMESEGLDASIPIAIETEAAKSAGIIETALPDRLELNGAVTASYSRRDGALAGRLRVGGCAVSFYIDELRIGAPSLLRAGDGRPPRNHICTDGGNMRQKAVVLDDASTPPLAAEVSLGCGCRAALRVRCRAATPAAGRARGDTCLAQGRGGDQLHHIACPDSARQAAGG
jgi:hypothetical protein